jgi:photosystem II stability/assembly factor-like uncharacterized protein
MLKTIDGGTSWSVLKTGTTNRIISVYFSDPLKGCALMEKGVLKTSDGGKSWTSIAITTSLDLRSFCFTDGLTGFAVGDGYLSGLNHGTIYKTTNGGSSWAPVCETNHGFWSVYFFDSSNGYAMGVGQSMSKTSDGGYIRLR